MSFYLKHFFNPDLHHLNLKPCSEIAEASGSNLYNLGYVQNVIKGQVLAEVVPLSEAGPNPDPRFILLDEPFAGVDPIAVIEIQRIVRFLRDRNIGVLITDHNVRETLAICDHAYIINEGSVLASGSPKDIIDNPEVRTFYLGDNFRM